MTVDDDEGKHEMSATGILRAVTVTDDNESGYSLVIETTKSTSAVLVAHLSLIDVMKIAIEILVTVPMSAAVDVMRTWEYRRDMVNGALGTDARGIE